MGVEHTVPPDGRPPDNCSIHCACIAVWPKGNETEMGNALFTKNGEGRKFGFFDYNDGANFSVA